MKKSLLFISAAILIAGLFTCRGGLTSGGDKNKNGGNNPQKQQPEQTDVETSPITTSSAVKAVPEAVDIFIDASGSMKGYIDGVQGTLKDVVPQLIPNLKHSDRMSLDVENINCYTIDNETLRKKDTNGFNNSITNASIFNGQSTEVHEMFNVVAKTIVDYPKHVGVIISDCVLSFPGSQLTSNREKNYNDVGVLTSAVTDAMTTLYNNGMNVSVVKYTSDFNGNYYYDYHNQRLSSARNQIMSKRPFYLVLVGKRELVDAMFNKNVIPQGYEAVFSFNKEGAKPQATFLRASKASSWVPKLENNVPTIATNVRPNRNIEAAYAYMIIDRFELPSYLESKREEIMGAPKYDGKYIASVSRVMQADIKDDLISVKGQNPDLTGAYIYKITFQNNETLKNLTLFDDRIYFEAPATNAASSEIEKDDANSLSSLSDLEGKTFMFNHLITGLRNAYSGGGAPLAEVHIKIETKQ